MTTDQELHSRIDELVQEEYRLWEQESREGPSEASRHRLEELRVTLDQCWDLLRQRKAREEFGQDPDQAEVRPADVVEGYEQ